jgi:hypothetical protein
MERIVNLQIEKLLEDVLTTSDNVQGLAVQGCCMTETIEIFKSCARHETRKSKI